MITVLQFILALSLLIILHEGGHFFFARLFNTKVEKFFLFFDPYFSLFSMKKINGKWQYKFFSKNLPTEETVEMDGKKVVRPIDVSTLPADDWRKHDGVKYGIGWLPLGGYVKIAGMVDESMDRAQMSRPPQSWEFRTKPAWQRLLIMLGGIIVNVLLALVIFSAILWAYGEKRLPLSEVNAKGGISITDSIGYKIGLQDGDKIVSIDGRPVKYFDETFGNMLMSKTMVVSRDGHDIAIQLPENIMGQVVDNKNRMFYTYPLPAVIGKVAENSGAEKAGLRAKDQIVGIDGKSINNFFALSKEIKSHKGDSITVDIIRDKVPVRMSVAVSDSGTIGFVPAGLGEEELSGMGYYRYDHVRYSFLKAIPAGAKLSWDILVKNAKGFAKIFQPKTEAYKGVGSFITMAKIYGPEFDGERFWRITGLLSLVLAFMNFLPIPGLDGGHVMFTLWEMVTGKKVSDRVLEIATTIGVVILLGFMFFALGNDIFRNFFR